MAFGTIAQAQVENLVTDLAGKALQTNLDAHTGRTDNPHGVTASQTGADTSAQVDAKVAVKANQTDLDAHTGNTSNPHSVTTGQIGAIPTSEKGAVNGVATLDGSGKIPQSQIPAVALERITVVANQAVRFALTTNDVQDGDVVKQTDTSEVFVVSDDTNLDSALGYTMIASASMAPVDSVFGRVGAVAAQANDYPTSYIDNDSSVNGGAGTLNDALQQNKADIDAHGALTNNPHSVTASQVGAYTTAQVNALFDDAANIGTGVVSTTEFEYLNGLSGPIQGQIDSLAEAADLDLVPAGTVNGTNRDFLLQSGAANVTFSTINANKIDVYIERLWQVPVTDYSIIDNGSGDAMIRFEAGKQPDTGWGIYTRGKVS